MLSKRLRCAAMPLGVIGCSESRPNVQDFRPTYFKAAAEDAKACGNRVRMIESFQQDVQRWQHLNEKVPAHQPFSVQAQPSRTVRIISWNVNNLCGTGTMASAESIEPDAIAHVLRKAGADVIVLQEALTESKDYDDKGCEAACTRMQQLDELLKADGYTILRSGHAQPVAIASRLPVTSVCSMDLDEGHQWQEKMRSSPGKLKRDAEGKVCVTVNESRPLLYAQLKIGTQSLGVFGAHFHHVNYTETADGIRLAESKALVNSVSKRIGNDAVFIAADFNQPRERDQPASEWKFVAEACKKFKNPQDDGVANFLEAAGFKASWDLPGTRNFQGSGPPPMTHWTGTTVDFLYLRDQRSFLPQCRCKLAGTYVLFTDLSDHLPIIADLEVVD